MEFLCYTFGVNDEILTAVAPCRDGQTDADRGLEADRAVLYAALLLLFRPAVRIKPALRTAATAVLPAVRAFCAGDDPDLAAEAERYAQACGGLAFLVQKAAEWRARMSTDVETR